MKSLAVKPDKIVLKGIDDAQQLILTADLASGRHFDLTHDAAYEVANEKIVRVTSTGRVIGGERALLGLNFGGWQHRGEPTAWPTNHRRVGALATKAIAWGKANKPILTLTVGPEPPCNFGRAAAS